MVRRVLMVVAMCAVMLIAAAARAQTAHFSYAYQTLGGGYSNPLGVTVDGSGNVYVADSSNNAVKKMAASCTQASCVTTLGGGFNTPYAIALDGTGNVYVADTNNNAVKMMASSCTQASCVTTLGGGFGGPIGVTVDGSGTVYVADAGSGLVKKMASSCTQASCVTTLGGGFYSPDGIAVDGSGHLYITEYYNNLLKTMSTSCTQASCVTTLGGGFSGPYGVAVDGSGNIYVADITDGAVKILPTSCTQASCVTTLGGGFAIPYGLGLDSNGNIYVADTGRNLVKRLSTGAVQFPSTAIKQSYTQTLSFTFDSAGMIAAPVALTLGTPGLDFKDAGTGSCTTNGTSHAYAAGDTCTVDVKFSPLYPGVRQGAVQLTNAHGAVMVTAYVTGTGVGSQVVFFPGTAANLNTSSTHVNYPFQTAQDGAGNTYVSNYTTKEVLKVPAGGGVGTFLTLPASTGSLLGLALDGAGNVFAVDHDNRQIVVVPASGTPGVLTIGGGPVLQTPKSLAVDGNGNLFISDISQIVKVQLNTASLGTGSPTGTGTVLPTTGYDFTGSIFVSIVVDPAGAVYASDMWNNRVVKVQPSGATSFVSTGSIALNHPQGLVMDAAGTLYIADASTRIIEVSAAGVTSLSMPLLSASPSGLMIDPTGSMMVADFDNNRVLQIDLTAAGNAQTFPSTVVSSTSTAQTVTLQNIGNADLSLLIPTAGSNPSISTNFSLNSTGSTVCPLITTSTSTAGTVASGTSCLLPVSFAPTAAGSVSGSLVLTNNNLNVTPSTTQTIPLNGTATAALSATQQISQAFLTVNFTVTPFTPVTGNDGTRPYTFSISPALPAGLAINSSTGAISGTPTIASTATTYTVTITDSATATASKTFQLTVNGPVKATVAIPSVVLTVAQAATPFTPVNGTGGTAPLTYSVSPSLPTGLVINGSTGVISGTPTAASAQTAYTVTVTDSSGATATNSFTLTVNNPPTISFAVPNHTYGDVPFTVSATSNSSGAFTYSVVSGAAAISGSTVTLTGIGAVVLQVDQAAASGYSAGSTTASFTVAAATPTLSFAAIGSHTYGDTPFAVSATSASSGTVTYAVTSGPATISGSTVTITGAGTVALSASQIANGNYTAATASTSFTVAQATPTLSFAAIGNHTYGDTPFAVSATSASTGAVTYAVTSGPATISGNTVTITGAGTVTLSASQVADSNYVAATATTSFTVAPETPTLSFAAIGSHTYGDAPFAVSASSASTGAITYSVTGPATVAGNVVTITGAGTITVQASQAAAGNYAAGTASVNIVVNQAVGRVTFSGSGSWVWNGTPIVVTASSNSTGTLTLSVDSGPATVSGNTVTITGAGTVKLHVNLGSDANYVGFVGQSALFVAQGTTTLSFAAIGNHTYGDAPFVVSATSASTGAVTYAVASGPATVAGNVVTITGAGVVTLSASQTADSNYVAATATTSFTVSSTALNITANNATRIYGAVNPAFSGTVTGAKTGDSFTESFTTTATATSAVGSYAIVPSVTGATLASYTVNATNGALTITQAPTTTVVALSSSSATPNQTVTLTANVVSTTTGTPTGTVTFLDNGVAVKTATLAGGVAASTAIFASGSHTITAAYSGDTNFLASVSAGTGTGVSVPALDFTLTGPAAATLTTNGTVVVAYSVTPTYGTYPGPVSFTVSGLPTSASYQLSQTAIGASAGPQTVSMTLMGPPVISQTAPTSRVPWSLALFLVPLLGTRRMRRSTRGAGRSLLMLAILLATAAGMSGLMGCGTGYTGLATKDYTVTVTATSGSVQHSSTLTLTMNRAQ